MVEPMNTVPPRFICFGDQLLEGGAGVRFDVIGPLGQGTAFVVRYKGSVLGYLNQCRHVPAELDWVPGQFFDDSGLYLVCATHGALYEPRSGVCLSGPCKGKGLFPIVVEEREGKVYWIPSERIYPAG